MNTRLISSAFLFTLLFAFHTSLAQDFWRQCGGPYSGWVLCMAAAEDGGLLTGTQNGVWRSTNDGESWDLSDSGLIDRQIRALVRTRTGKMLAGTQETGVLCSTDHGVTWFQADTTLAAIGLVASFAVDSGGRIFAGTSDGVFMSSDDGSTWAGAGLQGDVINDIEVVAPNTLLAATYFGGVKMTLNSGASWTQKLKISSAPMYALAIDGEGYFYACPWGKGVYRSTDQGTTWTPMRTGMENRNPYSLNFNSSGSLLAGTDSGIFISSDKGVTWAYDGLSGRSVGVIIRDTKGYIYAGLEYSGIARSPQPGGAWTSRNRGLLNARVESLVFMPGGTMFAGTMGGPFRSDDKGASWTDVSAGITCTPNGQMTRDRSGRIFYASREGIFRSEDLGAHWILVNTGLGNTAALSVAGDSAGNVICTTDDGFYFSTNGGGFWEKRGHGLSGMSFGGLAVLENNVYAGSSGWDVYLSHDQGMNWTMLSPGTGTFSYNSVAINRQGHIFYGTADRGILRSLDSGATWHPVNSGLTASGAWCLMVDSRGTLYAGADSGRAFRSSDNGGQWTEISSGLRLTNVQIMGIDQDGFLYAGTRDESVFKSIDPVIRPALAAPQLLSPADSARMVPNPVTMRWSAVAGAASYQLQLFLGSMQAPGLDTAGITDTQYGTLVDPDLVSAVLWRVRALNGPDTGSWSETFTYFPAYPVPRSPRLSSPANNAVNVPAAVTLTWEQLFGSDSYTVQLSRSPGMVTVDSQRALNGWNNSHCDFGPLIQQTKYYWRVRAGNISGIGPWSEVWSFTTASRILDAPQLVSPADGSHDIAFDTTLEWGTVNGAALYRLELILDNSAVLDTILSGVRCAVYALKPASKYYWHVMAMDDTVASEWSDTWQFTTRDAVPPAPMVDGPADSAKGMETDVAFSWMAAPGAVSYRVQLAKDAAFTQMAVDESGIAATEYSARGLEMNTVYHWRVRASNGAGAGEWSQIWSFTTRGTTGISFESVAATEFAILGINPHPVHDHLHLRLAVKRRMRVRIEAYSVLGRKTGDMSVLSLDPGVHEIVWRQSPAAAGLYHLCISDGSSTKVLTFIRR